MKKSKRNKILEAALEVFSIKGINKGTVSEIAEKAEVGKGTVYNYFESKEEIFIQLTDFFFADWMSEWKQVLDSQKTPFEKIDKLIEQTFDVYQRIAEQESRKRLAILCEILRFVFQKSIQQDSKIGLPEMIRDLYKSLKPVMEEGVEQGVFKKVDPEYLSFVIFGLLDGFSLHYFLQKDYYSIQKCKEVTKMVLLEGVLTNNYKKEYYEQGGEK